MTRLEGLLKELASCGFEVVDQEDNQALIHHAEDEFTIALTATDAWVQASQSLLDSAELAERKTIIADLAMRIHGRFLGCRFGFDDDGDLVAQYDVYPQMSGNQVATALGQLAYVAASALPLFNDCVAGVVVDGDGIDLALGFAPETEYPQ